MPEFLTHKYAKLPAWAWLAILTGSAYLYFRVRSGGTADATTGADSFDPNAPTGNEQLAGALGASQGYVQGYNSGYEQGTVVGTPPTTPAPGTKQCQNRRDPSGKMQFVCGQGFWLKRPGGNYFWVEGVKPKSPIQIVKGRGPSPKPKRPVKGPVKGIPHASVR
jgi:hypothetical protein